MELYEISSEIDIILVDEYGTEINSKNFWVLVDGIDVYAKDKLTAGSLKGIKLNWEFVEKNPHIFKPL